MLRDFFMVATVITFVFASVAGFGVSATLIVNSAECSAYGRQTGREVVFDWSCYARDDNGKMVPASQIGRKLEVTVK